MCVFLLFFTLMPPMQPINRTITLISSLKLTWDILHAMLTYVLYMPAVHTAYSNIGIVTGGRMFYNRSRPVFVCSWRRVVWTELYLRQWLTAVLTWQRLNARFTTLLASQLPRNAVYFAALKNAGYRTSCHERKALSSCCMECCDGSVDIQTWKEIERVYRVGHIKRGHSFQ